MTTNEKKSTKKNTQKDSRWKSRTISSVTPDRHRFFFSSFFAIIFFLSAFRLNDCYLLRYDYSSVLRLIALRGCVHQQQNPIRHKVIDVSRRYSPRCERPRNNFRRSLRPVKTRSGVRPIVSRDRMEILLGEVRKSDCLIVIFRLCEGD